MQISNTLLEFVTTVHPRHQSRKIPDALRDELNILFPLLNINQQLAGARLGGIPSCVVCGNPLVTLRHDVRTCSKVCREKRKHMDNTYSNAELKKKATLLQRYGVENAMSSPQVVQRARNTRISKYGGKGAAPNTIASAKARAKEMNVKARATIKSRYGVENPFMVPEFMAKALDTKAYRRSLIPESVLLDVSQKRLTNRIAAISKLCPSDVVIKSVIPNEGGSASNLIFNIVCSICSHGESVLVGAFKWRCKVLTTPCTKCSGLLNGSAKERAVADYVCNLIGYSSVVTNSRQVIHPLELDIWIPSLRVAIEFCGLYWHNDQRLDPKYHQYKYQQCRDKGIRLITIFEDEWEHRREIVKSRIANVLGQSPALTGARNCDIRIINTKDAREFLHVYHLQGKGAAAVAAGAYYNDQLISVMTLSKPTAAKSGVGKYEWELSRFATNGRVPGIASRLFKALVNETNATNVRSFCDLRWGTGGVYGQLGFEYKRDTPPNYWYVNPQKMERKHRYGYRKNSQPGDDPTLTEREQRDAMGLLRVYDCGSSVWEWTAKS